MKKIDLAKELINKNSNLFMCPKCGEKMKINDLYSLVCLNKHCFDLSKQGYVNLLLNSGNTEYDKKMLESRNAICKSGFFSKMIEQICTIIINKANNMSAEQIKILDAGCGEGSHLADILKYLHTNTKLEFDFTAAGIDISKEGIHIASREYSDIIWCVADLAKIPFIDKQFDIILNILSPSNYSGFSRVLSDKGILIKVVPGSNYLKELRDIFYDKTDKQTYSNEKVIKHFENNFHILDIEQIEYSAEVTKANFQHLINMTPLSWGTTMENMKKALSMDISSITVDLNILIGKKN